MQVQANFDTVKRFMSLATGDEKHEPSAHSTLDIIWTLYDRVLRFDPQNPRSEERDRFVLSKGHGPIAFFAVLAAKGFFPPEELKRFGTWDGILGGHPDRNQVPGAEVSTGSLGHGLSMAIGMALGLRIKRSDRRVFALIGDGETNEGSIWEAFLLAGNLHLPNLTCILVNNHSSTRDLGDMAAKLTSFGWTSTTINGRDHEQIYQALIQQDPTRPTAVIADIAH
ncbi:transketolase [Thermosporothrix hazakensis]|jgi:transketolase|uniref:Transketolase n=1 Tax=Thermosporothrix hazakensis TaxID=644383 RepID=A0A326U8B4_THEHA|nr:1-deoxy-D-xylulose-5-phosphate synthase N-terminal domain-containing protein [Thermosporothrix hazakensis]PZW29539.1 transketolase [Thermosporothrix hazakensis]GCE45747.1 transketolase [Thermosporothrix hazakensis]